MMKPTPAAPFDWVGCGPRKDTLSSVLGIVPALYRGLNLLRTCFSICRREAWGSLGGTTRLSTGGPSLADQQKLCPRAPLGPACTHISVMVSGRLAGMAVRPLPRQSTMPLLQLHMAGQEPEERVQAGAWAASPWPAETGGEMLSQVLPSGGRTREHRCV